MLTEIRSFYVDDEDTAKLLNAQFELIWEIIRYYVFYRLFEENFSDQAKAAGQPWLVCTQNAYQDSVARHWSMLFLNSSSDKTRCFQLINNPLTKKTTEILINNKLKGAKNCQAIIPNLSKDQSSLLETILAYAELDNNKFGPFFEKLNDYRNKRLIHWDLDYKGNLYWPAIISCSDQVLIKTTFGLLKFLDDLGKQFGNTRHLVQYQMITAPWEKYIQIVTNEAKDQLPQVIKKNWTGKTPF